MEKEKLPRHVAIILDGNGRWAKKRLLPRQAGHYQGGQNLVTIAQYANQVGIKMLTVYAFSTENWKRPKEEVDYLMTKPAQMIMENIEKFKKSDIKILIQGRKDRIPEKLLNAIRLLEDVTKDHQGMVLNICFDYGSYDELLTAFKAVKEFTVEEVYKNLMVKEPVDLLIRTSGELRISNFLLWQIAYAEFYFTKKHWPEFTKKEFNKAMKSYAKRNRRFGGLKQ
ncbi:polyprenyl diphosphate synthase [Acholeplasma equifetale]|uniref:polyprenyl diphosphate synthase n=1 Tax=Acholeplasma equifetale TaxID=264634 RepID=UPI001B392003|nr:polyprenyl diphosphate synthase [Acholeplasma equifetale]